MCTKPYVAKAYVLYAVDKGLCDRNVLHQLFWFCYVSAHDQFAQCGCLCSLPYHSAMIEEYTRHQHARLHGMLDSETAINDVYWAAGQACMHFSMCNTVMVLHMRNLFKFSND